MSHLMFSMTVEALVGHRCTFDLDVNSGHRFARSPLVLCLIRIFYFSPFFKFSLFISCTVNLVSLRRHQLREMYCTNAQGSGSGGQSGHTIRTDKTSPTHVPCLRSMANARRRRGMPVRPEHRFRL